MYPMSYSHEWGVQQQICFGPAPWGPGEVSKVNYHLISITKSISMVCMPNFMCFPANKRYKTYQTGFIFYKLGHAQGVRLLGAGGAQGVQNKFQLSHVAYQINGDDKQNIIQIKLFILFYFILFGYCVSVPRSLRTRHI